MRAILVALGLIAALVGTPASAQQSNMFCQNAAGQFAPVSAANPCFFVGTVTAGSTVPSTQSGGTVTTGGTFQQVLAANASRTGCTLQNASSHTGYVYWLGSGSATTSNALQLLPGQVFYCASQSGGVVKTAIQYTTGTTSDPFNYSENQ